MIAMKAGADETANGSCCKLWSALLSQKRRQKAAMQSVKSFGAFNAREFNLICVKSFERENFVSHMMKIIWV